MCVCAAGTPVGRGQGMLVKLLLVSLHNKGLHGAKWQLLRAGGTHFHFLEFSMGEDSIPKEVKIDSYRRK